ncbi:MAG: hypothetical protein ACOH18_05570 [Candidatus Saccharimonadaceae bacterium]
MTTNNSTKPDDKKADKSVTISEEDRALVKKWQDRLTSAKENQKKPFDKAKESYGIYYAIMSDEEKAKNWRSNTFLPVLPGKVREVKAKLSILEPRFQVTPADSWKVVGEKLVFDEDAMLKAMKVSKKLDREFVNYNADGGLPPRATVDFSVTDALVAGWGLALAPLSTYKKVYKKHQALKDESGQDSAYVDMNTNVRKELLRVKTELVYIDIFKAFISPLAKSWERPFWIMLEREDTYAGLLKKNGTKGEQIYNLPKSLKDAKPVEYSNDYAGVRDLSFEYNQDGSDFKDDTINLFTIFDCYDEDENEFLTFVLANIPGYDSNWFLARRMDNPYNHGLIPIVPFHTKRRANSPFGESFLEISKDVQHAINASYNQFDDNAKISGETMAIVDKNSLVDGFDVKPGGTIEYDSLNGEKPEPWTFNTPNPAVLGTQMEILERNIESGTTPQYASGQVNSNMDKTAGTKGGIGMLMEAANDKVSEMYRELKSSLLRYGYISMHNAQQYQNYIEVIEKPDMSRSSSTAMNVKKAVSAEFITPSELQESFDLDIDDESLLPMTRSERREMFVQYVQLLIEFQKASGDQVDMAGTPEDLLRLDWADVSKELGVEFGRLNAPAFIKKPLTKADVKKQKVDEATNQQAATDEASQIAQKNNPGAEVQQDPNGLSVQRQKRELSNFKDYPADVKNAVLADMGYPESQIVSQQAEAQLAEAKATQLDTAVKEKMIQAADSGMVDPATLAKFVGK